MPDQTQPDEINELYRAISHELQRSAMPDWVKLDISIAQIKVLTWVHYDGRATIKRLAEVLNISAPTVSQLVEKLVQAKLIERTEDPQDRRCVWVQPTGAGHAICQRLYEGRRDLLAHWVQDLSADELTALTTGLRALIRIAQNDPTLIQNK